MICTRMICGQFTWPARAWRTYCGSGSHRACGKRNESGSFCIFKALCFSWFVPKGTFFNMICTIYWNCLDMINISSKFIPASSLTFPIVFFLICNNIRLFLVIIRSTIDLMHSQANQLPLNPLEYPYSSASTHLHMIARRLSDSTRVLPPSLVPGTHMKQIRFIWPARKQINKDSQKSNNNGERATATRATKTKQQSTRETKTK